MLLWIGLGLRIRWRSTRKQRETFIVNGIHPKGKLLLMREFG